MKVVMVIVPRNEVVLVSENEEILYASPLMPNEKLVSIGKFNDFVRPFWDEVSQEFIESASQGEIDDARSIFTTALPSTENMLLEIDYRLSKLELGV